MKPIHPEQIDWPKPNLFPRARRVASFLFDHLRYETPSEHFRGASAQLDSYLYDELEEVPDQLHIDSFMGATWVIHDMHDSEGRYIEPLNTIKEMDRKWNNQAQ